MPNGARNFAARSPGRRARTPDARTLPCRPLARSPLLSPGATRRAPQADIAAPGSCAAGTKDARLAAFCERLLDVLRQDGTRNGQWQLLECVPAWDGNGSNDAFIASAWRNAAGECVLATVNYAPHQSQCYVRLPFPELADRGWRLSDRLGDARYDRDGNDFLARGLYLDAPPWEAAVFSLSQRD